MVYKVYKSNNYIIIIDENDNYFEEHCANVLVTKLLTPSTTYNITFFRTENVPQAFYNIPFANIRQQSGAPYTNVATWESWYTLNTGLCSNAAVLNSILATLQAQTDVEGVFVKDVGNLDKIILQVKVWDQDSQTYIATYYYNPDGTLYTPIGPLEWVGTAGSVNATIISPLGDTTTCADAVAVTYCAGQATEFFDQGDTLDSILTELTTGTLDVNITNPTLAVTQSGIWTVGLDAATLLALETVTVNQGTSPWVVSATDLDIRNLDFATDAVDVSGSTVSATITGPLGGQDCDNSLAVTLCDAQAQNLLEIKDAVTGTLTVGGTVAVTQSTSPWIVNTNSIVRIPAVLRTTGGSSIPPGARSFSILNAGSGIGSILGGSNNLLPGEEVDFVAGGNDVFGLISFNGNGVTTLVVTYVS
jgi:hypothetical protein